MAFYLFLPLNLLLKMFRSWKIFSFWSSAKSSSSKSWSYSFSQFINFSISVCSLSSLLSLFSRLADRFFLFLFLVILSLRNSGNAFSPALMEFKWLWLNDCCNFFFTKVSNLDRFSLCFMAFEISCCFSWFYLLLYSIFLALMNF